MITHYLRSVVLINYFLMLLFVHKHISTIEAIKFSKPKGNKLEFFISLIN